MELHSAGALMNLPDQPGVYIIVCSAAGRTTHRPGDILYIGSSDSIRRRVAYAMAAPGKSTPHSVQAPLLALQKEEGVATLLYCLVATEEESRALEDALLTEFRNRVTALPVWNKQGPSRSQPPQAMVSLAKEIVDMLNPGGPSEPKQA